MKSIKWIVFLGVATFFAINSFLLFYPFSCSVEVVYIPQGTGSFQVASILKEKGVIRNRFLFLVLGRVFKIFRQLQAGEYMFGPKASTWDVVRRLSEGRVEIHRVTIPEGYTAEDIAMLLSMQGIVDFDRFLSIVRNANFKIGSFSFPSNLEGYLFPDTYNFVKSPGNEEAVIRQILSRFKEKVVDTYAGEIAKKKGYTFEKVIIVASMVEKEALVNSERPIIARIFYNRLKCGMSLQSCSTVRYALGKYTGRLTNTDLRVKSLFNTYLHKGLPPHPICSPGIPSIEAAIRPAEVNYLYFVSRNDGTHHFTRSYEEHCRAKKKYQGSQTFLTK